VSLLLLLLLLGAGCAVRRVDRAALTTSAASCIPRYRYLHKTHSVTNMWDRQLNKFY
jgi:hypothetical protein